MEIGVGGYGYTGSSAVFSLLQEFNNVRYIDGGEDFEFTLSYAPDGLEDLEFSLVDNPSKGMRCDIAIYRFLCLIDMLERSYNRFTKGQFRELTNAYLSNLIQVEWDAIRVFEYTYTPRKRIEKLLRMRLQVFLKKKGLDIRCFPLRRRFLSIFPDAFVEKTRKYVTSILESDGKYDCIVLNQPFSVGDPLRSMKFFMDPKFIVVDRDPRDLYVLCKNVFGIGALFIPTDSVEHFIDYYKRIHDDRKWKGAKNILRVQFEDLLYRYEDTIDAIKVFLGDAIGDHLTPKKYFDPEFSIKNTNIFSNFPQDSSDIARIEKELQPWVYNFPARPCNSSTDLNSFTFM